MSTRRSFSKHDKHQLAPTSIDPICNMVISPKGATAKRSVGDKTFYFCSDLCAEKFDQQPQKDLAQ